MVDSFCRTGYEPIEGLITREDLLYKRFSARAALHPILVRVTIAKLPTRDPVPMYSRAGSVACHLTDIARPPPTSARRTPPPFPQQLVVRERLENLLKVLEALKVLNALSSPSPTNPRLIRAGSVACHVMSWSTIRVELIGTVWQRVGVLTATETQLLHSVSCPSLQYGSVVRNAGNTYFTERCSGSEADRYLRLIDFVYHPTLGLRVIHKKKRRRRMP